MTYQSDVCTMSGNCKHSGKLYYVLWFLDFKISPNFFQQYPPNQEKIFSALRAPPIIMSAPLSNGIISLICASAPLSFFCFLSSLHVLSTKILWKKPPIPTSLSSSHLAWTFGGPLGGIAPIPGPVPITLGLPPEGAKADLGGAPNDPGWNTAIIPHCFLLLFSKTWKWKYWITEIHLTWRRTTRWRTSGDYRPWTLHLHRPCALHLYRPWTLHL